MRTSYLKVVVTSTALVVALRRPAFASGSGMPWEAPLQQVVDSITGPVARKWPPSSPSSSASWHDV